MQGRTELTVSPWLRTLLVLTAAALIGCGAGDGVSVTGGTEADQAAILAALEDDGFFTDSVTDTDVDEEAAAAAQAEDYSGPASLEPLSTQPGTAELPRFWWRGGLERIGRTVDIHIENGVADVTVVHDIAGTFFIVNQVNDILALWGKPFEDIVTRYAQFTKYPWGWALTAVSPVEFAVAGTGLQTAFIDGVRAYAGAELLWEASEPDRLYSVSMGLPIFAGGDEIRIEADVVSTADNGWQPTRFVFLHKPGPHLTGRRTRDLMFDDGTNGDLVAGDGTYTRTYTIGPCRGRHFAAVDVIDASTFMERDAPYNSGAWGMPYIVE